MKNSTTSLLRVSGRVVKVLDPITGENAQGKLWSRQQIVVEVDHCARYKNLVCLNVLRSQYIGRFPIGTSVEALVSIESRPLKTPSGENIAPEKWISNVVAYSIRAVEGLPINNEKQPARSSSAER